jgi:23S rRNA pseudouridine2605 synthase
MQERLQKILSRAGIASRRAAEVVISHGRVTVNGETVHELGTKADVAVDDIRVDGVRIKPPDKPVYLLLYKPRGYLTTRHDPEGRPTVMQLVPSVAGLFPVGRLDYNTEGVLLLTNDGALAERVAHPRYEMERVYHAKVKGVPTPETLARLRKGVTVEGDRLTVDNVRILEADNNAWLEVVLHEGKHHEVRRLLMAVGHGVSKLKRISIGPLSARGLASGQFRSLTPQEIEALRAGEKSAPRPFRPRATRTTRRPRPGTEGRRPEARREGRPEAGRRGAGKPEAGRREGRGGASRGGKRPKHR